MTSILQVKKDFSGAVMDHPEIVGTDITLDRSTIVIYVTPHFNGEFPRRISGYPLDTRVSEHYHPHVAHNTNNRKAKYRPIVAGVSAGCEGVTAGTMGAIVFDNATGDPMALSNNHVFAAISTTTQANVRMNEPIIQPGRADSGTISDTFAILKRYVPIDMEKDNLVDAAVAAITSDAYGAILGDGDDLVVVKETAPARTGIKVMKYGRTSGWSEGKIIGVDSHTDVNMSHTGSPKWARFVDQISINIIGKPGDSGSLIIDEEHRAIGLLSAGEGVGSRSRIMANKIGNVAGLLGIHF